MTQDGVTGTRVEPRKLTMCAPLQLSRSTVLLLIILATVSANSTNPAHQEDILKRCYDKYGCYSVAYPWNCEKRPINLFPEPPESVNPQYCLYTRRNPYTCDQLEIDKPMTLYRSNYVPRGQVYLIAHGFVEHGNKTWIKELTAELLARSSANVIVIDWSGGSSPPYAQAVANIRLVGVMTAHLIKMMSDEVVGLKVERIHVIGHSLGAHLSSYIGTTLRRTFGLRLGRISGLDPAGPHFAGTEPIVRLDPSDAIFVDNIHTDTTHFIKGGLGILEPIGHIDFYPNGGKDQPGCEDVTSDRETFFDGVRRMLGCNHIRSFKLYIETVNSPEKWLAAECPSWEQYLNGSCFHCQFNSFHKNGTQCARFGFHSVRAFAPRSVVSRTKPGTDIMLEESPKRRFTTMYLTTGKQAPYHRSQYRVTWQIAQGSKEIGMFRLSIQGRDGKTSYLDLAPKVKYYDPGSLHSIVIGGESVGKLVSAALEWSHKTDLLNPLTWRVNGSRINIRYITVDSLETGDSLTLCTPSNDPLRAGVAMKLTTSCNLVI